MSIYAASARFDTARPLTDEEMYRVAPSIFAESAHESRSAKFAPIPTIMVLKALQREGFHPVAVKQGKSRVPGKADFTKHLIRLRRLDNEQAYKVGDNVLEMLLQNANDGTSQYDIMAGLFRVRCLNSLVAKTADIDSHKVRHSGNLTNVARDVIEGTYTVLESAKALLAAPEAWGQITLNREQRLAYAEAAHTLRFPTERENAETHPIRPESLLMTRRYDDEANDLWTTFNVVQENAIKGGLHGRTIEPTTRRGFRRVTTREIKGIDQDVKLNKALWMLTERMAELAS